MKKITIAIDGYSACGKSTLAKQLADSLHYLYLDTGAMYRAVTLFILDHAVDWKQEVAMNNALQQIHIDFNYEEASGRYETYLNAVQVEQRIRSMQVNDLVSEVAARSNVRKFLVLQQRRIGAEKGIVLDGRDIGTHVFPDAELKVFVIADMQVRVQRRHQELLAAGMDVSENDILKNLVKRDHDETTRSDSPLKKAGDALVLDTTSLTQQQQLAITLSWAEKKISGKREM